VPIYNFVECPFENIGIQRPDKIPSKGAVKDRIPRPQTIRSPHPQLRWRKWKCIKFIFAVTTRHY